MSKVRPFYRWFSPVQKTHRGSCFWSTKDGEAEVTAVGMDTTVSKEYLDYQYCGEVFLHIRGKIAIKATPEQGDIS